MNGDLGKGPATTAVYATNAIEQTLMGPAATATGMAVLPGGAHALPPTAIMQTAIVPAQAIAAATEYALVNGNMLTAAAAAAVGPADAADYYQTQATQNDAGGCGGVGVGDTTKLLTQNDTQSVVVGGGVVNAIGGLPVVGVVPSTGGDMMGENGITLEHLKQKLTTQLEYYFSW